MNPLLLAWLLPIPLLLGAASLAALRRWWLAHGLALAALSSVVAASLAARSGGAAGVLGMTVGLDPVPRLGLALAAGLAAVLTLYNALDRAPRDGRDLHQAAVPGVAAITVSMLAAAALGGVPYSVSVVLLLVAMLVAGVTMLCDEAAWQASVAASTHLVTATLAGIALLFALLLADLYRLNPAGGVTIPLVAAGLSVGWGLLLGATPFHFALTNVLDRVGPVAAATTVAVLAPVALASLVQGLSSFPWLVTDPRVNRYLFEWGLVGAAFGGFMAVGQAKAGRVLGYAFVHDLGFTIAGLATYTRLGTTGALLQMANRSLAATLLLLTVAEWQRLPRPAADTEAQEGRHGTQRPDPPAAQPRSAHLSACLAVGVLSLAGTPPTSGFISRWTVYQAASLEDWRLTVVLAASTALLFTALVRAARRWGWPGRIIWARPSARELLLLGLAAATVGLGIYPAPVVSAVRDAVQQLGFLKPI